MGKFQPRVIKQNRGSAGEGIWIIKLKSGEYCSSFGEASCGDDEVLDMMEANDNHAEEHTVAEFIEFCVNGRTDKSGDWSSKGSGKYLEGGKEAGGQLVDQRLCPRIKEGEVRVLMVGDECQMIIHKMPTGGGLSAVGGNSDYTFYAPDDPKYAWLYKSIKDSLPTLMPTLGLTQEQLPILWTTDFIPKDPEAGGEGTEYVVGEFNCSCVGISKFQAKCGGSVADVADEDYADGVKLTDMMGRKAVEFCVRKKLEAKTAGGAAAAPAAAPEPAAAAATETFGLTPEQVENVTKAFKAADTNNSDALEAGELKAMLKAVGSEPDD